MMQIVIGDFHFGKYNNNQTWLESQKEYFESNLLGLVNKYRESLDSVIFLGDIFDNRQSLNGQVGYIIKQLFRKLCDEVPNGCDIYCIAGNHDYYSPVKDFNYINWYEIVFGEEFEKSHPNIHFINRKYELINNNEIMLLPWYCTEDEDGFIELIKKHQPKVVYCHTDIYALSENVLKVLSKYNTNVYSGHIHTPSILKCDNSVLYELGSCLPLDFNDVNSWRYIYVFNGKEMVEKLKDDITIQFRRYYNEDIFSVNEESFKNCKTEIWINSDLINTARYVEQINYIRETYVDYKISIKTLNEDITGENNEDFAIVTNINNYIENNIPEHLKEKYNYIKEKVCS